MTQDLEKRILAEIERRALGGDLERAACLLGYAKEIGLCVSTPDLFERQLGENPLADGLYFCRARVKLKAQLREEAVVDLARGLLVCGDVKVLLETTPWVGMLAAAVPTPAWVKSALESIRHRLDGTRASEWRHLVLARDGSDDVAVHVRMAQLRQNEGGDLEVSAMSAVHARAPRWLEGWLRLVVVRAREILEIP